MENKITKEQWEETNKKMLELFSQIEKETIPKMPLWMRMNYFSNKVSEALNRGYENKDINWKHINEMCSQNLDIFDYNMYEDVYSLEDFEEQRFNIICATEGIHTWQKHKCKDCESNFYMFHKEVMFFEEKGLSLPKRCPECRKKRKEMK